MTRWGLSVLATLALLGVAEAQPKKKVKIETEPVGATVYLNAKEDGPVCTTPCTIDVPVGDTPIIVELEGHKQLFENLMVPAKKPLLVKYKLVPAIGTINVKGPANARITVDDVDKGRAPTAFEVPAGAHTVVLTLDGKKIDTKFVDVPANDEVVVEGKAVVAEKPRRKDPDEEEEEQETGGGGGNGTEVSTTVTTTEPSTARGPYISLAVAMDVGFRSFEYDNPTVDAMHQGYLTPESEGGQVLVGPVVEIWPGTLAGMRALRGLSLFVRFGYGVNSQQVKQKMTMTSTSAKTFWRAFEASVRQRFTIKDTATLEIGAGYVRDQYQFEGRVEDIDLVPDADYQSMRLGARISYLGGTFEPYLAFENRFVLSAGTIETRFNEASASGIRVATGVVAKLGSVRLHVEGALNRYSWTLKNTDPMPDYNADGGTDSIKYITAGIGYAY